MNNLTIQILNHLNQKLNLDFSFEAEILIGEPSEDLSKTRNELSKSSKTEWQLWLEPWETILGGEDQILWAMEQGDISYNVQVIQEDVITKQTRLWKKSFCKCVRPIYEGIEPEGKVTLDCFIRSDPPDTSNRDLKILLKWKEKNILTADLDYYLSYNCLARKKYDEFIKHANHYLFRAKDNTSIILTHYYLSLIFLMKKDYSETMKHVVYCLSCNPTMAEFWCVLGDLFFQLKQHQRASAFYQNAIVFGSRRKKNDPFPIEIKKYKEYPEKKMDLIKKILSNSS
jgi:tetratricopeptide (TPR) repeat protein